MLSNYNKWSVLSVFFKDPFRGFGLRELSREVSIAPKSVKNYLIELIKEGLIIENNKFYKANRDSNQFIHYKKINNQETLWTSGLINYIYDLCLPDVIILFGSYSKGEDIKSSDIDLYVQSGEKRLNLEKYEKIIGKKINIFFSTSFNKLSNELKNNILNGIMLKGYLKVFL